MRSRAIRYAWGMARSDRPFLHVLLALLWFASAGCSTLGLSESDDDVSWTDDDDDYSMDRDPCGTLPHPDCVDDTTPFWVKVFPSLGPSDVREYELFVVNG